MPLDRSLAEGAAQTVASGLGLEMIDTAAGIHEVVNQNMAAAASMHGVEMGVDLRGIPLIAFGRSWTCSCLWSCRAPRI